MFTFCCITEQKGLLVERPRMPSLCHRGRPNQVSPPLCHGHCGRLHQVSLLLLSNLILVSFLIIFKDLGEVLPRKYNNEHKFYQIHFLPRLTEQAAASPSSTLKL